MELGLGPPCQELVFVQKFEPEAHQKILSYPWRTASGGIALLVAD